MGENKRPRRRHRRGVEALKSLLILVLSLSAFYLTLLALDYSRVEWAPIQAVLSLFRPEQEQSPSDTVLPGSVSISPTPVRVAVSDGTAVTFTTEKDTAPTPGRDSQISPPPSQSESAQETCIGNLNSKVFHREDCPNLPAEQNQVIFSSREEAVEWMKRPLPLVDVLKLSDEELPLLTGTGDPEQGTAILRDMGIRLVLLTLGGDGAYYRMGPAAGWVKGVKTAVADTNGAGDTFLGAVLSRLVRRGEKPLEGLTVRELEDILAFANRAASKTCSRSGAIPAMPTLAEL